MSLNIKDILKTDANVYPKARLHDLFAQIEKEFDALWEENLELKAKLGLAPTISPSTGTRKPGGGNKLAQMMKIPRNVKPASKPKSGQKWMKLKDFVGHRDGVWEVSACPWDVNYFASASADHSTRVWSADGSRGSVAYLAHTGSVNSVRFHPVERLICTASGDKSCHIWKLPITALTKNQFPPPQGQTSSLPSKGGAGGDAKSRNNKLWTPLLERDRSKEDVNSTNNEGGVVGTSPSGSPSVAGTTGGNGPPATLTPSASGTVPINIPHHNPYHDAVSITAEDEFTEGISSAVPIVVRTALVELKGHTSAVVGGCWTGGGGTAVVATASWDNTVRLWNVESGRTVSFINIAQEKPHRLTYLSAHPTSSIVVLGSTDGSFRLWDHRTPPTPGTPDVIVGHQSGVTSVLFSHDGNLIVSGSDDRTAKVWDVRNTKTARTTVRCHSGVNRLSISPVSSTIVIPTDDRRTTICDVNGIRKGKLHHQDKSGHKSMVSCAAWSTDESVIYTTGFDRRVIAWAREP